MNKTSTNKELLTKEPDELGRGPMTQSSSKEQNKYKSICIVKNNYHRWKRIFNTLNPFSPPKI